MGGPADGRKIHIRRNGRGLVRLMAAVLILGVVATLATAGALTWLGQP